MLNLDRFSRGLADQQSASVIVHCAACQGEIYGGELVYRIGGDIIHTDCLAEYAEAVLMSVEDAVEVAGEVI